MHAQLHTATLTLWLVPCFSGLVLQRIKQLAGQEEKDKASLKEAQAKLDAARKAFEAVRLSWDGACG